jgi:anaerobic selenocysteine-containing dehydrogenase
MNEAAATNGSARAGAPREVRRTACSRDCPDVCTIHVEVEHGRAVALRGSKEDPITRGFLCERTSRFLWRHDHPERLLRPLLRRGGKSSTLEPVSWDEALAFAAEKLVAARAQHGPASILHYRSGGSLGMLKVLGDHLFELFGPTAAKVGDVCSGAGEAAQDLDFGMSESNDFFDLRNARAIVLWGKNPHASNVHLLPLLKECRGKGAKLIAIDPLRTRVADESDLYLQVRPGGDAALAFGALRWVFEHGLEDASLASYAHGVDALRALCFERSLSAWAADAGVAPEELEAFAALYAESKPAAIQVGWGMGRRKNGGSIVRAIDALAAVCGNMGVPGGGASFYYRRRFAFDTSFLRGPACAPRVFSEPLLGEQILAARDPEMQCLWITAGNPVAMLPDSLKVREALLRVPFVAVVDTHPTDTTDVADLVLPTLTLLEDSDLLGAYGNHYLRVSEPAVAPAGEARHELAIWQGLAEALDRRTGGSALSAALAGTPDEWKRRLLRRTAEHGVDLERLRSGPARSPFAAPVAHRERRFATPNGRAQLLSSAPPPPPRATAEFPLLLLAVSTPEAQASQRTQPRRAGPPLARVHPSAASGWPSGARVRLESRRGALQVELLHDERVHPEVLHLDKGGMLREGACANLLVAAFETDLGQGAAYYDEPVRLVAL